MVEFAFECFTNREFGLSSPDVEQVIEVNPVDGQGSFKDIICLSLSKCQR